MLKQEYTMRAKMDNFEQSTKTLLGQLKSYSLIEFFHEEAEIKRKIKELSVGLEDFNMYLPETQVKVEDEEKAKKDIIVDLRERINSYIMKIDHQFALDNYKFVIDSVNDKAIKDIYRLLGPFDHYEHHDADDELDTQRSLSTDFIFRKSGARYRGQVHLESTKPDGIGFKIYANNSIFEGFFSEG